MSHWYYLKHPAVRMRSVLAAHYLRNCPSILEVGGFGTPITEVIRDKPVVVVDPIIEPAEGDGWRHIQDSFLNRPIPSPGYGLVALGMHFSPESEESWSRFAELVRHSSRTVVEFASTFQPSRDIFNYLTEKLQFSEKLSIRLDFSQNDMTGYDHGYPLFLKRELWMLTPARGQ